MSLKRDSKRQEMERVSTDRDVEVVRTRTDVGVLQARDRFGGIDLGAALGGLLAGVGMAAIFGGIAGGIGTVGYQLDVERDSATLSTGGFVAGLVVLFLSFLVAGWVAGRIARYDGGKNGLLAAVLFIVVGAALAGLGAWLGDRYDVYRNISLPQWFRDGATTATGVLSAILAVIVVLFAGFLGGKVGERYHRKADRYLAANREDHAMLAQRDEPEIDLREERKARAERERETVSTGAPLPHRGTDEARRGTDETPDRSSDPNARRVF